MIRTFAAEPTTLTREGPVALLSREDDIAAFQVGTPLFIIFCCQPDIPPMNNLTEDFVGVAAAQRTQTMYAVDRNKRPIQLRSLVIRPSSGGEIHGQAG